MLAQLVLIGIGMIGLGTGQYLLAAVALFTVGVLWTWSEERER